MIKKIQRGSTNHITNIEAEVFAVLTLYFIFNQFYISKKTIDVRVAHICHCVGGAECMSNSYHITGTQTPMLVWKI